MIRSILSSSLVQSAVVYTGFRLINSSIPFLMLPLLTRYLSPSDYGVVAMFSILLGLISPFVGLNIHGAIGVRYFDSNKTDLPNYIGNSFIILTLSTVAVSLFVWTFSRQISAITAFPQSWLWSVVLVAAGQYVILVLMILWQAQNKAFTYGVFQILQTAMNIGLSIVLIVYLGQNWQGRIEAQVIAVLGFAVIGVIILHRTGSVTLKYNRAYVVNILKFGVPLIPHELGSMLILQTDRMFITNMVGLADAGIYTVGLQLASIVELGATSFNLAYSPWLYMKLAQKDPATKRKIVRYTYLYFILIALFAMALSLCLPWVLRFIVGNEFIGAGKYVFWLALGFSFSGMYFMVAHYVFYAGATHLLAMVTFFSALVNIALNYVLIKKNGAIGAAQASTLSYFISFALTWFLSARVYNMPWNLWKKCPE